MNSTLRQPRMLVVGLGFVGLTLSVTLAKKFQVVGVDENMESIDNLRKGKAPFFEQGLVEEIKLSLERASLSFLRWDDLEGEFDAIFICVGTPYLGDLSQSVKEILKPVRRATAFLSSNGVLILRSTLPIGASQKILENISGPDAMQIPLAYCPERTMEGKALKELIELPQIIGSDTSEGFEKSSLIFSQMGVQQIVPTSGTKEAEMAKLASNAYRDLVFAFSNELANISHLKGVDVHEAINASNLDYARSNIPKPGITGGPCLSKDPLFLVDSNSKEKSVIAAARKINSSSAEDFITATIRERKLDKGHNLTCLILGLAFKGSPSTSDVRGSGVTQICAGLRIALADRVQIIGFDPLVATTEKLQCLDKQTIDPLSISPDLIVIQNNNPDLVPLTKQLIEQSKSKSVIVIDFWNMFQDGLPEVAELVVYGRG